MAAVVLYKRAHHVQLTFTAPVLACFSQTYRQSSAASTRALVCLLWTAHSLTQTLYVTNVILKHGTAWVIYYKSFNTHTQHTLTYMHKGRSLNPHFLTLNLHWHVLRQPYTSSSRAALSRSGSFLCSRRDRWIWKVLCGISEPSVIWTHPNRTDVPERPDSVHHRLWFPRNETTSILASMPKAVAAVNGFKNMGCAYVDRDKPAQIRFSNISAAKGERKSDILLKAVRNTRRGWF